MPVNVFASAPAGFGSLADGVVFVPSTFAALFAAFALAVVAAAAGQALIETIRRDRLARPRLRLVPTANAWGLSDRATLDESAVGL